MDLLALLCVCVCVSVCVCVPLAQAVLCLFSPGGLTVLAEVKHSQDVFRPVENTAVQLQVLNCNMRGGRKASSIE